MRKIGAIVLAAGGSRRLGQPKQLIELDGETLVHAATRAAQEGGCGLVCVVTGHAREAVENAVADLSPLLVHNDEWPRGMGSSIRLGVEAVQLASAAVLLACDQPAVDARTISSLIALHGQTGQTIVASRYSNTLGIPALFGASCFCELRRLPDARGAKVVIEADAARVMPIEFPAGAFDLDSPGDVRAWFSLCRKAWTGGAGSREDFHAAHPIHPQLPE